jgi:hypothetical protein
MPSIVKYIPVSDEYTTYNLLYTPSTEMDGPFPTFLGKLDEYMYVSIPDNLVLPEQPSQITIETVTLTPELKEALSASSPHVALVNARVREKIAERYALYDEIKLIRTAPSDEFNIYNAYVEGIRAWGRAEKAKFGL